jgi:twinfilin-like protein
LDSEKVDVDSLSHVPIQDLQKTISANAPRFTFYIFDDGSKESLGML